MRIGVLALQGGVEPHVAMLESLGHEVVRLRHPVDFENLDGLVLPGGESTTQRKLIDRLDLHEPLQAVFERELPILATCAGVILASDFGWLDVELVRNGWGRQRASFEACDDDDQYSMTFIRAPRLSGLGSAVTCLATYDGEPVVVRQGSLVATTFHPELAGDVSLHREVFGR